MQTIVVDTSVFIERLDILNRLLEEYEIVFPIVVADELNHLKDSKDADKSYKARKAIKYISEHSSKWYCDADMEDEENDMAIILTAQKHKCSLATFDLGMVLRAELLHIPIVNVKRDDKYVGYKTIKLNTDNNDDMDILAKYYENKDVNIFNCLVNEYIIIKQNNITIETAMWNGEEYKSLKYSKCKNIIPKTDTQALAIDLILNKDIPVKTLFGSAGSGKTFLATKLALQMLKSPDYPYETLMLVRNPIGSGERIGFLKGDKDDKIKSFFNPFVQHFDGEFFEFESLVQCGRVKMEIPYYMKGLDLTNTLVLFDEAEDCSQQIIKLIGSRLGEGSALIITGDSSQAENKFGRYSNGLELVVDKAKGNINFGCVYLPDDLRSSASKMFVDMF